MDNDKLEELYKVDTETILQILATLASRYQIQIENYQKDLHLANLYISYVQCCIELGIMPKEFLVWCKCTNLLVIGEVYSELYTPLTLEYAN